MFFIGWGAGDPILRRPGTAVGRSAASQAVGSLPPARRFLARFESRSRSNIGGLQRPVFSWLGRRRSNPAPTTEGRRSLGREPSSWLATAGAAVPREGSEDIRAADVTPWAWRQRRTTPRVYPRLDRIPAPQTSTDASSTNARWKFKTHGKRIRRSSINNETRNPAA